MPVETNAELFGCVPENPGQKFAVSTHLVFDQFYHLQGAEWSDLAHNLG